jgi:hypothetical protein
MVEVRRALLLLTLAGCNDFYGLDPTTVRDLEPPPCATVQFGAPIALPEFAGDDNELDSQLSADGTELWFTSNTGAATENRFMMFRATRASTTEPFNTPATPVALPQPSFDAALTADGRRMMFLLSGSPPILYEGVRETANQFPFDTILNVNGFSQFEDSGGVLAFDLSWDGLRIYFIVGEDDDGVLWTGRRDDRNQPFGSFDRLFQGAHFPTVSGDELEVFHVNVLDAASDRRLYRRERAGIDKPFGPPQLVLDDGADPDIAPTSKTMLISRDGGLSFLERRCD